LKASQRIKIALDHKEPDRVPIDLGGHVTGITQKAHANLKKYYGIKGPDYIIDKNQQLVKPAPEILNKFNVDTRYIYLDEWKIKSKSQKEIIIDNWGIKRKKSKNHAGGFYYNIIEHPLADKDFEEIKKKKWTPSLPESNNIIKNAKNNYNRNNYTTLLNYMGSIFEKAWNLRGFENFLIDLHQNTKVACYIMDQIVEHRKSFYEKILPEINPYIDIIMVGDDLGIQSGPLISPDIYKKIIKPRQEELYRYIKKRANVKLLYHSCGDCSPFIPDLIEIGIDILNPVQVSALDPVKIKEQYGEELTFWGGIDTQKVLPYGDPEDVKKEVKKRIYQMAAGGGYVLNSVHNIQDDVPPENIEAMFEAALEFGKY